MNGQCNYDKLIRPEWGGFKLCGPPQFCHTFEYYIPAEQYGKTHPEWFPLIDGKRMPERIEGSTKVSTQLCLTNTELRKTVLAKLKENIRTSYAEADQKHLRRPYVFDVSQNDGGQQYCQCEKCQAIIAREGAISGLTLDFINDLADGIKDEYPEVIISTFAYNDTEMLPKYAKPRPNVMMVVCDTKSNTCFPVGGKVNSYFEKLLSDWAKISNHLRVWDYTVTHPVGEVPQGPFEPPYATEYNYQSDLKLFRKYGVEQYFTEHEWPVQSDVREYKMWMLAKLMANPDSEVNKLMQTFADGYYGPAGKIFLKYRKYLRERMDKTMPFTDMRSSIGGLRHLDLATVTAAQKLFDEGELLVKTDPVLMERWNAARLSLDRYSVILQKKLLGEHYLKTGSLKDYPLDTRKIAARVRATLKQRDMRYPYLWPRTKDDFTNLMNLNDRYAAKIYTERDFVVPEQFKSVPKEKYFEFTNDEFQCWRGVPRRIEDKTALSGNAVEISFPNKDWETKIEKYVLPMKFGIYSPRLETTTFVTYVTKEMIKKPGWNWYHLGKAKLVPDALLYATWSWFIQQGVGPACDVKAPDAEYEIWVNLKLSGSHYPFGKASETDSLAIERFVLIRVN